MAAVNGVDLGRYEDGSRIVLPVPGWGGAHWVVAGSSGSGKTSTIRLALARMAHEHGRTVAFAVSDPHFVGYRRFVPRVSSIAYGFERALGLLNLVVEEMDRRYRVMYEKGIEEWSPDLLDVVGPYLVLVVDELAAITLAPKPPRAKVGERQEPSAENRLIALAQQIRKTGGGLILATQSPKTAVISNLVLEQCPIRFCGKTRGPEQTKAVLESERYPCHLPEHPKGITIDTPGVGYVDDGHRVRRGRADGIRPEVFAHVAVETARDRHDFGWPHEIHPMNLAAAGEGAST